MNYAKLSSAYLIVGSTDLSNLSMVEFKRLKESVKIRILHFKWISIEQNKSTPLLTLDKITVKLSESVVLDGLKKGILCIHIPNLQIQFALKLGVTCSSCCRERELEQQVKNFYLISTVFHTS